MNRAIEQGPDRSRNIRMRVVLIGAFGVLFTIHVLLGWHREVDETVYLGWIPGAMALHILWVLIGAAVLIALLRELWPKSS